ncbi:hypothetical protein BDK51DRAFT_52056 [Blyttiomyces helicus]|uniref:Uncharacterized protein n=1 Tax=Blyttiomyces helicus TaxID=388810 RepID=A0A4P9VZQ8_9FUNG|nr:hypothetical protein BDK51DRAFT_52056 [Blyttiomyces helicus]|eukprot:RKO83878.1 hypothetical protein BDK51DRAFT_52056 [Blyttiomyces helicus]
MKTRADATSPRPPEDRGGIENANAPPTPRRKRDTHPSETPMQVQVVNPRHTTASNPQGSSLPKSPAQVCQRICWVKSRPELSLDDSGPNANIKEVPAQEKLCRVPHPTTRSKAAGARLSGQVPPRVQSWKRGVDLVDEMLIEAKR